MILSYFIYIVLAVENLSTYFDRDEIPVFIPTIQCASGYV